MKLPGRFGAPSTTTLVFLDCYGALNREGKDRRVVRPEAGRRVSKNATHRANRAAPGPDDTR